MSLVRCNSTHEQDCSGEDCPHAVQHEEDEVPCRREGQCNGMRVRCVPVCYEHAKKHDEGER